MKLNIKLDYDEIQEVIQTKEKGLIIKFRNGDRLSWQNTPYSRKLIKHLKKNFAGEHLD